MDLRSITLYEFPGEFKQAFRLVKEDSLGHGFSGDVFLVANPLNPNDKKAAKLFMEKEKRAKHFHQEVSILERIHHPYIISNVTALNCFDCYAIMMPYFPAGTLSKKINASLTNGLILKYFLQLVSAVVYLHDKTIVHRDIKPANIVIDENDNVKLIDFGFAHFITDGKPRQPKVGTRGYTSPELRTVGTDIDFDYYKCDMYSVGMVLMSMVYKCIVPATATADQCLDLVKNTKDIPKVFGRPLRHLLTPDSDTRWNARTTACEMATFPRVQQMLKNMRTCRSSQ